jgi:hypothetical protein
MIEQEKKGCLQIFDQAHNLIWPHMQIDDLILLKRSVPFRGTLGV